MLPAAWDTGSCWGSQCLWLHPPCSHTMWVCSPGHRTGEGCTHQAVPLLRSHQGTRKQSQGGKILILVLKSLQPQCHVPSRCHHHPSCACFDLPAREGHARMVHSACICQKHPYSWSSWGRRGISPCQSWDGDEAQAKPVIFSSSSTGTADTNMVTTSMSAAGRFLEVSKP